MVKAGEELMSYDDRTKLAIYFYQGDECLRLTVEDFKAAKDICNCLQDIYKKGAADGVTAAQCAVDSIIL